MLISSGKASWINTRCLSRPGSVINATESLFSLLASMFYIYDSPFPTRWTIMLSLIKKVSPCKIVSLNHYTKREYCMKIIFAPFCIPWKRAHAITINTAPDDFNATFFLKSTFNKLAHKYLSSGKNTHGTSTHSQTNRELCSVYGMV